MEKNISSRIETIFLKEYMLEITSFLPAGTNSLTVKIITFDLLREKTRRGEATTTPTPLSMCYWKKYRLGEFVQFLHPRAVFRIST
jgi:hypothetical protein